LAVATELTVTPLAVTLLTLVDGSPETFTQPDTDMADAEKLKLTVCAVAGTIPAHNTSADNDNRNNRRSKRGFILLIILIFIFFNNRSLSHLRNRQGMAKPPSNKPVNAWACFSVVNYCQ
jgi:hypothetical protein